MAPKKAKEEPKVEEPVEPAQPEESEPPPVHQKCFQRAGQLYYGSCIAAQGEGSFVRQGFGCLVATAKTASGESVPLGSYEGNWDNDKMHGNGTYKWPDGSCYEGGFIAGQMDGFGRFQWPEGSVYEGTWVKGQMTGQGRFDSRFDGGFLQGRYHRDCYQGTGGKWTNVHEEHRAEERKLILSGSTDNISILHCDHNCSGQELLAVIASIHSQGYVPFLVADSSSSCSPCSKVGASDAVSIRMAEVATAKKRHRDYKSFLYASLQDALTQDKMLHINFEDKDFQEVPTSWSLDNFFDSMSFPVEVFHNKFFNTRGMAYHFLPAELRQKPSAAAGLVKDIGSAVAESAQAVDAPDSPPPSEQQEPRVYLLRSILSAEMRLPSGLEDGAVREHLIQRYSTYFPLHRTSIVLLQKDPPE